MVKMRKRNIILLIIAGLIVSGGVAFGIVVIATWGEYKYSNTFYYDPSAPSPLENVSFSSDVGNIIINYNTTPTNYAVKLDLDIRVSGGFVAGKSFSDFFKPITWSNESVSIITFSLEKKPTTWSIFPIIQRITINITLRTDVTYDIEALTTTGSIEMDVPTNCIINNTILTSTTGSVSLSSLMNTVFLGKVEMSTNTGSLTINAVGSNFVSGLTAISTTGSLTISLTSCDVGDNLVGTISTGSISINSYNTKYSKDSIWDFETSTGSIDIQITQLIGMDANITGNIQSSTGSIDVIYNDAQSTVGAEFTCSVDTGSITYIDLGAGGMSKVGDIILTDDYNSAIYKYTFSLTTSTGSIEVRGQSL